MTLPSFPIAALFALACAPVAQANTGVVTTSDVLSFAHALEGSDGDPAKVPEHLQRWREAAMPTTEFLRGEGGVQRIKPSCRANEGRCAETSPRHCRVSYWSAAKPMDGAPNEVATFQTGCATCLDALLANGASEAKQGILRGDLGLRCDGEVAPRRQPASVSFKVETLPSSPCHREPEYFSFKNCDGGRI